MKKLYFLLSLILLIFLVLPSFVSDYILGIFVLIFFYAYIGQCWNVLTGYAGPISLGHSLYLGIGAYISTKLAMDLGISPWIGMWVGGLGACLVGLTIGFLGFRFGLKGVYFVLLTIAFGEIGRLTALHLKPLGHMMGLFVDFKPGWENFHFRGNLPYYYIALGFVIFSLIVVRALEVSKWGRYFIALREDEDAAESLGVNVFKYKMIAIALSSFMTALGGTFYANYIFYLHPTSVMSMWVSIEIIMRPIIGGIGTLFGPLIGSLLLTPLSEIARSYFTKAGFEGIHIVIYGLLLVVAVLFFPGGIFAFLKKFVKPLKGDSKDI